MGTIIFYIITAIIIYYSIKFTIRLDNHYKWFSNLKAGDRVKVRIYSINCDCSAKATIITTPVLKHVQAKLDTDDTNRCKDCALINGITPTGENTCWYNIEYFDRSNITKLIE